MTDPSSIISAIQAISQAIQLAKELSEISHTLQNAEMKLKLAELAETLADAKLELVSAQEQNARLTGQVEELKVKLAFAGTLK